MSLVPMTGFAPMDRDHRELEYCLGELAQAMLSRDHNEARGRTVLLVEQLREHFAEEEEQMRTASWSLLPRHAENHARMLQAARRIERDIAVNGVSSVHQTWVLVRFPEVFRFHVMRSDFGFAKFALGVARDPVPGGARTIHSPSKVRVERARRPISRWAFPRPGSR